MEIHVRANVGCHCETVRSLENGDKLGSGGREKTTEKLAGRRKEETAIEDF